MNGDINYDAQSQGVQGDGKSFSRADLAKIAKNHRLLLSALLVHFLMIFIPLGSGIATLISLGVSAFSIFAMFQLGRALKQKMVVTILIMLALLIPYLNILVILALHGQAMKVFKANDMKVGFLGAKPNFT